MIRTYKSVSWLFPMLIALCTFMVFRSWPYLEREWLIQGVSFLITLLLIRQFYVSRSFICIVIYCFIMFLNVLGGDKLYADSITVIMELFKCSIPAAVTCYFLRMNDMKGITNMVIIFLAFVVFTTISSYIISFSFPGIIRTYVSYINGHQDHSQFIPYLRIGMSNYFLPHALPVLIPALYLGFSNRNMKRFVRVLLLIVWVSIVVLTYLSGATTALLFSLLFSILMFFIRRKSLSKNIVTILVFFFMIILLLLERQVLSDLINNLEDILIGTDYSSKVVELGDIVESSQVTGGDAGNRADLYNLTIIKFFESPIIGTNDPIGGHSALLDRLSSLGLLGFIPFIYIFISQMKFVIRYISDEVKVFYVLGMMIGFLMLLMKYMLYFEMSVIMLTILPLSIKLFGSNSKIKN